MGELHLAVVDDDPWKRDAISGQLNAHPAVAVVHAIDQDTAAAWTATEWEGVDFAIVDVFDDRAPSEKGTDLFSGINALERLKSVRIPVMAITPQTEHPLVELRLWQAQPNWIYRRSELLTVDDFVDALFHPAKSHQLVEPKRFELLNHGATKGTKVNDAVRIYVASDLYGRLVADVTHEGLGIARRKIDRFTADVGRLGFLGKEPDGLRWPEARDFVLRLLGRLEGSYSDFDRPWLASIR